MMKTINTLMSLAGSSVFLYDEALRLSDISKQAVQNWWRTAKYPGKHMFSAIKLKYSLILGSVSSGYLNLGDEKRCNL